MDVNPLILNRILQKKKKNRIFQDSVLGKTFLLEYPLQSLNSSNLLRSVYTKQKK